MLQKIISASYYLLIIALSFSPQNLNAAGAESAINKVIFIDEKGVQPEVTLPARGGTVFFYNQSGTDLMTLAVDFGKRVGFCASGDMKMTPAGIFKSIRPIVPGNFAPVCFPHKGKYAVKITNGDHLYSTTVEVLDYAK